MNQLTEDQRLLVAEHLELAAAEAKRYARRLGRNRAFDQFTLTYSDAVIGLCDAAMRFSPHRGWKFITFATPRIRGAILDGARSAGEHGMGYGRRPQRQHGPLTVASLSAVMGSDGGELADQIPDQADPIGWEIESEDYVRAFAARIPKSRRDVLIARLLNARTLDAEDLATELGVDKSQIHRLTKEACVLAANVYAEIE